MKLIPHIAVIAPGLAELLKPGANMSSDNFLSELYMSLWDFDEVWYLSNYPDLKSAIPSEIFPTGWHHFKAAGYFEGRLPLEPDVDEGWYLRTYPDVAAAILDGVFANGREHFQRLGYREGRLPADPGVQPDWYRPRYMRGKAAIDSDAETCTDHFVKFGYLRGAIAAPPK